MFKLKQALRFALALLVATSTCVAATDQKRSNATAQCLNSRGDLVQRAPPTPPTLSFDSSQWIWTSELTASGAAAPVGSRAFRKTFVLPEGKVPAFFTIAYAVDDEATLWVNGEQVVTNQVGWTNVESHCVSLESCGCALLIALNATNVGGPAGLLVDSVVTYTDGTTSTIVSDGSWRASTTGVPDGFQDLSFDDSAWALVKTQGANGIPPWGTIQITGAASQSLDSSVWVWTNETPVSGQNYPPNTARAFRYTMTLPDGHTSGSATAMIVADDQYSLYINGHFIGTGTVFNVAQMFVADVQGPQIVIAVYAENTQSAPTPAGVLASIQVVSQDGNCGGCSSTTSVISGTSWKAFPGTIPSGFEQPGFDDSAWPAAGSEGQNGAPGTVWAKVSTPTTVTTGTTPLPGAPAGS